MYLRSAHIYEALYTHKDYAGEVARLNLLLQRYARVPCSTLLDVACGTGRHLELLRDEFQVQGLDLEPTMLAVAAQRLPGVALHQADCTDFSLDSLFDVVVCFSGSIGYARTEDGLRRALHCMARHVRVGGLVVVEPWLPPEQTQRDVLSVRVVEEPDLRISRMRIARVEGGSSILHYDYLVTTPEGNDRFVERHELGIFSHDAYLAAFSAAGLTPFHDEAGISGSDVYVGVREAGVD